MILKGWISLLAKIILFILLEVSFTFFFMGYFKRIELMNKIFISNEKYPYSDQTSLIFGLIGLIISFVGLRFIQNFQAYEDKYSRVISEIYFIGIFILMMGISTLGIPLSWNTDIEFRGGLAMVYGLSILLIAITLKCFMLTCKKP